MTPQSEAVLRTVLELRIHGVNNTSPQSMLDVPECVVEQVDGDKLSSFWRTKPHLLAEIGKGQPGYTPPHVLREAYSWGGMARNSPGATGGGVATTVWKVAARISWALLLPFGLANVAYWTRRLGGKGAASARLFGLGLTALIIVTTCEVALDLIAAQCYAHGTKVCTRLPDWLGWFGLENPNVATRIGYASVLPVALLLVLWQVSRRSGVRYEQKMVEHSAAEAQPDERSDRMLASPTMWRGAKMLRGLVRLHLAVGFAVVVLASSWAAVFGTGEGTRCRRPEDLVTRACWAQVSNSPGNDEWIFGLITVGALLVVLTAATILWRRTDDRPDFATSNEDKPGPNRLTWIVVVAALLLLAAHWWALFGRQPMIAQSAPAADGATTAVQPLPLPGINAAPTIVVAILLGLALSGLTWRTRASRWFVLPLGAAVTLGLLATARWQLWVVVAVLAAVALVGLAALQRDADRRFTAWAGMAPGVVLGIALLMAMTLSTIVVVAAGDWLNGKNRPADLASCVGGLSGTDPHLCVPPAYVWFGAVWVVAIVVLFIVAVLLIVVWLLYRLRGVQLPGAFGGQAEADMPERIRRHVWRARHHAALAHRAEKVAAVLGVFGLAATFVAVFGSASRPGPLQSIGWLQAGSDKLASAGLGSTALTGLAVVFAFAGGRLLGGSRPLGLVWDLICFLPRAAHPFGPPCYAERAVPEILDRCHDWLCDPDHGGARTNRIVVLSAHSLGGVLAVATLFLMPRQHLPAMRLITYGTQLRAYFGRIFPELLGSAVLGTPTCTAARLAGVDPWHNNNAAATADREAAAEEEQPGDTVRSLLTTDEFIRWRNLWRRTDYLGFPVYGYIQRDNPIDQDAQEFIADTVLTHGGYPATSAYQQALAQMIGRVSPGD
ncbi:MAG: hypothetical protein ACRDSF_05455 [Pseudonocardiaceae bacterium]